MGILEIGQIVFSKQGRDKGLPFMILRLEANYVYLVDGKLRKLASPKKKKLIHVAKTNTVDHAMATLIQTGSHILDSDIRKIIKLYRESEA